MIAHLQYDGVLGIGVGVGCGLSVNVPVPTQAWEWSNEGSHNCKVWAETVGRRDDKTVSGHASKTLSQAAISSNCNDHVLREQRNISDIMVFVKTGQRRTLWYVCGFVCFGCTPATSTEHRFGTRNYSNSGQTFVNILQRDVLGVWSNAEPPQYMFHTERFRQGA